MLSLLQMHKNTTSKYQIQMQLQVPDIKISCFPPIVPTHFILPFLLTIYNCKIHHNNDCSPNHCLGMNRSIVQKSKTLRVRKSENQSREFGQILDLILNLLNRSYLLSQIGTEISFEFVNLAEIAGNSLK